jgi:hypothetical protein
MGILFKVKEISYVLGNGLCLEWELPHTLDVEIEQHCHTFNAKKMEAKKNKCGGYLTEMLLTEGGECNN